MWPFTKQVFLSFLKLVEKSCIFSCFYKLGYSSVFTIFSIGKTNNVTYEEVSKSFVKYQSLFLESD